MLEARTQIAVPYKSLDVLVRDFFALQILEKIDDLVDGHTTLSIATSDCCTGLELCQQLAASPDYAMMLLGKATRKVQ